MNIDVADDAMYGFIQGGVQGWYQALTDKPVVISKSRTWTTLYHLFPESKYIAMVRDIRDVIDSFERLNSKVKALHSYDGKGNLTPGMAVHEKYAHYFTTPNAFSGAYTIEMPRLVEHANNGLRDILFIRYEDLITDPERQIARVYKFLGEEPFEHDLENIEQPSMFEHDGAYFRERTSHKVEGSLKGRTLPNREGNKELMDMIVKQNIPYYEMFYPEVLA